jgi:hypothetical protein
MGSSLIAVMLSRSRHGPGARKQRRWKRELWGELVDILEHIRLCVTRF